MGLALTAYRAALDYLFARTTGGTKFGLERTRALLAALGDPHDALAAFHVGGTNGKGSTTATLDAVLRAAGLRVGRYTSPHLVDFRERIVVDGEPISEDAVVDFIERWTPTVERLGATFFEATTAMAFDYLARAGVDASVIEVGLGGRLDSTNVITPLVAGVTSIGLDHTEFLGDTLEDIAREKAGIFKPGRPAVIGERRRRIYRLLEDLARAQGASPVLVVPESWPTSDVVVDAGGTSFTLTVDGAARRMRTPLIGAHQASNAALALAMLACAGGRYAEAARHAERALAAVRLPGRFQRAGDVIFDVAHNRDGAAVLARTLEAVRVERPLVVLLSVLRDKDWRGMMTALARVADRFVVTSAPTAPAARAWRPEEAAAYALARGWAVSVEPEFDRALALARSFGGTALVTGSFHTVGDAMVRLQVSPLAA